MKPLMLMILDGWGIAPAGPYNAAKTAQTPQLAKLFQTYPHTRLQASGNAVGLPEGQMGNSEVGHLNIGAGRIVYQELTRITKACDEGTLLENKALLDCMASVTQNGGALHLMGLLSDGGVHSHEKHLWALLKMAKAQGLTKVYVHAFLDGRDVGPSTALTYVERLEKVMAETGCGEIATVSTALTYVERLEKVMAETGCGEIATVSGRYYAMDRDKRWERTQKAYDALTQHAGETCATAAAGIEASYAAGKTDEFVEPFIVETKVDSRVKDGDGIIFYNFRPDRARQLTRAFTDEDFAGFARTKLNISFVCMTQYDVTINAAVAFPPESLTNTLGEVLAQHKLHQLRIAETEKYAHVTFFFNGGVEEPNPLEDRVLIPSPKVATYDLQPEMSAYEVTDKLLALLDENKYDVIILNFANPDMVGHTGVMQAAVKAMEAVDACAGKIADKVLELGGAVCITADHGNLERMYDEEAGQPYTAHTTNPVPFLLVSGTKYKLHEGILADIAPTMLELLGIAQPAEMTGHSLIEH